MKFQFPKALLLLLLALTIFAVFVPLFPMMPGTGGDHSWVYGMNQALAQGLAFGRDFIFTFGPFASIYTHVYHPASDHLMILGSLYLAACYFVALLYLSRTTPWLWILILGLFIAGFIYLFDALLSSYPLLIALIVYRMTLPFDHIKKLAISKNTPFLLIFLFSSFGLLPLIKGSLILISIAISGLCFLIFWLNKQRLLAVVCVLVPCVSMVIFWLISGQAITGLPYYFLNMLSIISGYTEAMTTQGNVMEILVYLIASGGVLYIIISTKNVPLLSKLFLLFSYAAFLFLAFKAGFVRHDLHAIITGTAIMLAALLLPFTVQHRHCAMILFLAGFAWFFIDKNHINSSTGTLYERINNTYKNIGHGIKARFSNTHVLENMFTERLNVIKQEFPIPIMDGTTDIYSAGQSYLLASGNRWSPRPVFQSYSVYTPRFAKLNELHLTSDHAPDNILFRIEPTDGRFPSLEDGLSWPTIINNYFPVKLEKDVLFLLKKPQSTAPIKHEIYNQSHILGEEVLLPDSSDFLFVEIDLKPTLIGRLMSLIYKPTQLEISVTLQNGSINNYRFISSMAKSGFIISPLINNAAEFGLLFAGPETLYEKQVKSIRISSAEGGSYFWNPGYAIKISHFEFSSAPNDDVYKLFHFEPIQKTLPAEVSSEDTVICDGFIDSINDIVPAPSIVKTSRLLSLEGWFALSGRDGTVPEMVFITLTDKQGNKNYIQAQKKPRDDVKIHFKQPDMPDVGYKVYADVSELNGEYRLGLSGLHQGKLLHCQQFNIPIQITQ